MGEKAYRIHIRQGEFELDVEGDRAFVESYVDAFLSDEGEFEAPLDKRGRGRAVPKNTKGRQARPRKGAVEVDKAALRAFVKGKKATSNKDRYLLYMRFWRTQGLKQVGDGHVQACFSAEGLPIPPTGRQNFGSLRKEGLVKAGTTRGMWALTEEVAEGTSKVAKARRRRKGATGAKARKAKPAKPAKKTTPKKRGRPAGKAAKPPGKPAEVAPPSPE